MTVHKGAHRTSIQRRKIFKKYYQENTKTCDLCRPDSVSRPTIYRVFKREKKRFLRSPKRQQALQIPGVWVGL